MQWRRFLFYTEYPVKLVISKKFQAGGYRITKTEYQKFNISKKSNMFLKSLIYTDWKRFLIIMT